MENKQDNFSEENFLPGIGKKNSFAVPKNYFEELENSLEYKYEQSLYPTLNAIKKPQIQEPSSDYFKTINEKIQSRIEQKNELEEFKILSSIKKENNFTIAPNYFNEKKFSADVKKTDTPVINIFKRLQAVVLHPKMAYAAGIALIIGLAGFWYYNKTEQLLQPGSDCKTLACLEKRELLNEQNMNDFDDENLYEMVDVELLDKNVSEETEDKISDSLKK